MTEIDTDALADCIVRRIADALEDGTYSLLESRTVAVPVEGVTHVDANGIRSAFARRLYAFTSERGRAPKVDIDVRAGGYSAGTTVDIVTEIHLY